MSMGSLNYTSTTATRPGEHVAGLAENAFRCWAIAARPYFRDLVDVEELKLAGRGWWASARNAAAAEVRIWPKPDPDLVEVVTPDGRRVWGRP